ncbi:MAG: NfeD family protein [Myxococcota bacterium]
MLTYLYLATLVFGGVLLGASILLGGQDDLDADGDLDGGGDLDADLDADGGVDKGFDVGAAEAFFWPLKSVRFWTFFSAFFGLTGLALQGLGLMTEMTRLAAAIAMGSATGLSASYAIRRLAQNELGRGTESSDYIGKSARVMVPVKPGGVGKVRVQVGGSHVELLAVTDDEHEITGEDEVLVVDIEGTRARIARLDTN